MASPQEFVARATTRRDNRITAAGCANQRANAGVIMKDTSDQPRKVFVTLAEDRRQDIEQIAAQLRAAGMKVTEVYPEAGTVTGEIPPGAWDRVSAVEGVTDVEEEPIFRAM
jgi:hypothetical protein